MSKILEKESSKQSGTASPQWSFLSNHAHVLVCLAQDPNSRLRDVADDVGITERGVLRIVRELEEGGILTRVKTGRRNHYELDFSVHLRHPLESDRTIGSLLRALLGDKQAKTLGIPKT